MKVNVFIKKLNFWFSILLIILLSHNIIVFEMCVFFILIIFPSYSSTNLFVYASSLSHFLNCLNTYVHIIEYLYSSVQF